jgi:Domain of unknown function (DUF4105)
MKKFPAVWPAPLLLFSAWAATALFLDLSPGWLGVISCLLYLAAMAALWGHWHRKGWRALAAWTILNAIVLGWWLSLRPTNDRPWQTDVARLPWAEIDGGRAVIHEIRNFDYRTERDYTPHWETRPVDLAQVRGVDIFLTHWGLPLVAHAIVSFQFADGTWLATSIEARQSVGQEYSAFRGFFRQYELIYLLAEERDLVRLRTNYRHGEEVYLYHTRTTPADARRLFLAYLGWMNAARSQPQWYNALTDNCSTPFISYLARMKVGGVSRWDWRGILDGSGDRMLYQLGDLAGDLPFAELKRRAWINPAARAAEAAPDFSRKIREHRPGFALP